MASIRPAARSMLHWDTVLKHSYLYRPQKRCYADMARTATSSSGGNALPPGLVDAHLEKRATYSKQILVPPRSEQAIADRHHRVRKIFAPIPVSDPIPSARDACKEPLRAFDAAQIALLDPTGARTRLFARTNPDAARVGDVLLVRQKTGDPFAGVCINIRRRGADTGILLRGQLTRVGVEMWFKVYSPNVESVEVVQRYEQWKKSGKSQRPRKRPRRARLYYMRNEKHDRGSVEVVVARYQRERAMLGRSGSVAGKGASGAKTKSGKSGKK